MKKIVDWLLFGKKKKEDYVDLIISKVRAITKYSIKVETLIQELKKESDAMKFKDVVFYTRQIEKLLDDLKNWTDMYESIKDYIDQMTEAVDKYREDLYLICYGAKFI